MARETSPFAQRLKALAARAGLPVDDASAAAQQAPVPPAEPAIEDDEQPTGDTPALTDAQASVPADEIWTASEPAGQQQPQYSYPPVPPVYGDPSAAGSAEEETGETDALADPVAAEAGAEAVAPEPVPPIPTGSGPTLSPPVIPPRGSAPSWPAPEPQSDPEPYEEPEPQPDAHPQAWVSPSEEPWAAEPTPVTPAQAEPVAEVQPPDPEATPPADATAVHEAVTFPAATPEESSQDDAASFERIPEHLAYGHEPSPEQPAYEAPEQGAPEQHATPDYVAPSEPVAEHQPTPEQPAYAAPEQGAPVQESTPEYAEDHASEGAALAVTSDAATPDGAAEEQPGLMDRANAGLESATKSVAARYAATKASVAAARAARRQAKDEAAAAAAINAPVEAAAVLQESSPVQGQPEAAPAQSGVPTPAGSIEGAPEKPSFAQRAALRRRARTLRARRDAGLLELGAIVLDQRRFGDASGGQLTRRRVDELGDIDGELARIEVAIDEEHSPEALASLGIVRCLSCHALLGPRDHFCAQCGTPRPPADAGSPTDAS